MCLRASEIYVPTCLRVKVLKASQHFIFTFQCGIRHANILTWHANMPNEVLIFQTFLLQNAKASFYTLLSNKKIPHYT